jgi:hypothetical protein
MSSAVTLWEGRPLHARQQAPSPRPGHHPQIDNSQNDNFQLPIVRAPRTKDSLGVGR